MEARRGGPLSACDPLFSLWLHSHQHFVGCAAPGSQDDSTYIPEQPHFQDGLSHSASSFLKWESGLVFFAYLSAPHIRPSLSHMLVSLYPLSL